MRVQFFTLFLLSAILLGTGKLQAQSCTLSAPSNVTVTSVTATSISLSWNPVTNAFKYKLKLMIDGVKQGKDIKVTGTSYTFSNLTSSTTYTILIQSVCSNNKAGKASKIDVTTLTIAIPPPQITKESIPPTSEKISITYNNGFDTLYCRYGTQKTQLNTIVASQTTDIILLNLTINITYYFQVSTYHLSENNWTPVDSFRVGQPNVLIIMIDDARYDYYSCNGAPYFLQTPNIDRIANEGVNFRNSFVVTSLCAPSRASIATGLFTSKTGVYKNGITLDTTFNTLPKFMKNNGYYTALVGKNHGTYLNASVPEFNYYMAFTEYGKSQGMNYDYNGTEITIDKHQTLTLTDTTIALIPRIPQPFMLYLSYVDPHLPPNPIPSYYGRFANYAIPWKPDTAKYTVNYPSFLYHSKDDDAYLHGLDLDTTYRHVLEAVADVDSCVGVILQALENSGRLDNTLIIFLSDNGHMMGAHWLLGKTMAYDPSMRIPIFMRYPAWFTPNSVIRNQIALNVDLAPTIYQAAGLQYPDPMDGISLKQVYDGQASRTEFYYAMLHDSTASDPAKRAIRDLHYKYIRYSCNSDTTEEFFDMVNDSLEMNNLINNHNYDSLVAVYRVKFDSIKDAMEEHVVSKERNCYIASPVATRESVDDDEQLKQEPVVYPTLTDGMIEVYNPWTSGMLELYDSYGKTLDKYVITDRSSSIDLSGFMNGIYFVRISRPGKEVTQKIILQR